jgi:hypothetical protein
MKSIRIVLVIAAAGLLIAVTASSAPAQCAMCKAVIENSTDAAQASRSMNLAALVLLVPPVTLFSGLFLAIYKFRNVQGGTSTGNPVGANHAAGPSPQSSRNLH